MRQNFFQYKLTNSFIKKYNNYDRSIQDLIDKGLRSIYNYIEKGQAPYGLRIKHLGKNIFEARVNIHLRIAYLKSKEITKFFCLGNHDDIKHCLKNLRQLLRN